MHYTREQLEQSKVRQLKKSISPTQAELSLIEIDGKRMVLKHFWGKHFLWRWLFGRVAIAREVKAYKQLQGVRGIPQLFCQPDAYSLVMEFVEGEFLPHRKERDKLSEQFFQNFSRLVTEMHSKGVDHGDLRKKNVFVTPNDQPYILDFATAVCVDEHSSWLKRTLFKRMCRIDFITVAKLKSRYYPELLTESEKKELSAIPWYLQVGQFLRKKIYRPFIKPKYWHSRWEKVRKLFSK